MTTWTEFSLRPQGQPWPGLNTRGGRLDPGNGFLEDGSINAVINEADILEKRKGFVRGLNERFDGPVCGIFRYTDNCGVEYLVIADQSQISVRTPFSIPSYLGSDSLPFDDFEELDTTRWSNTSAYTTFIGALRLLTGFDTVSSSAFMGSGQIMQWFKESVLTSYYVEINYRLTAQDVTNIASVIIKRVGTTYLEAVVVSTSTTYRAYLYLVLGGVRTTLAETSLGGASLADGFLRLSYNADTFTATATVIPSGGSQVSITGTLTEAQDAALGQLSAIGLQRATADVEPEIESVSGGQL